MLNKPLRTIIKVARKGNLRTTYANFLLTFLRCFRKSVIETIFLSLNK